LPLLYQRLQQAPEDIPQFSALFLILGQLQMVMMPREKRPLQGLKGSRGSRLMKVNRNVSKEQTKNVQVNS